MSIIKALESAKEMLDNQEPFRERVVVLPKKRLEGISAGDLKRAEKINGCRYVTMRYGFNNTCV